MTIVSLRVEYGALLEVPCYESHKRGRNWAATISIDPKSPGGIGRTFWKRAHGEFYYLIPADLRPPVPVEFGADYYTVSGRKKPHRVYGVILSISQDTLTLEICQSAREAVERAEQLKMERTDSKLPLKLLPLPEGTVQSLAETEIVSMNRPAGEPQSGRGE
jgi:hypothetical protein